MLVATAAPAQAERDRDYYHVITPEEAADFAWIRDNVPDNGTHRALVEPWEGTAFHLLTGMKVYATYPVAIGRGLGSSTAAQRVLNQGVSDERFLSRANITLVYAHGGVASPNFTRLHGDAWIRADLAPARQPT
jgi:hypothetical protein